MKYIIKIIAVSIFLLQTPNVFCQSKKCITENGILLFSATYDKYLDTVKTTDFIKFVFIPDVFFPLKTFDRSKGIDVNFRTNNIKKGIGLLDIPGRDSLKMLATKFINDDTANLCYSEKNYYLLTVEIKLKILTDNIRSSTCYKPIDIATNNKVISFDYEIKDVNVIYIKPL